MAANRGLLPVHLLSLTDNHLFTVSLDMSVQGSDAFLLLLHCHCLTIYFFEVKRLTKKFDC